MSVSRAGNQPYVIHVINMLSYACSYLYASKTTNTRWVLGYCADRGPMGWQLGQATDINLLDRDVTRVDGNHESLRVLAV